ncbi:MAG: radical SAM protein [Patescibacteria group bacterium]|nr:radical SAM protein [Patescibacteria group bacterium]
MLKINKITVKSILTKSGFPDDDFCINPYSGCLFGCSYCFADFMRRFSGHAHEKWGEYVDIKVNAPELLEKELMNLEKRIINGAWKSKSLRKKPSIVVGSVTDPYQGVEAKYEITRKCLEAIILSRSTAKFNILTKGHLVTRDVDLLRKIPSIVVGFTITTTDDTVSRLMEGNAPPVSIRLKALKKLNDAGIGTYVCINPLLPNFVKNEKSILKLFQAIRDTGNKEIWLEHINLGGNKLKRITRILADKAPDQIRYFEAAKNEEYKNDLNRLIFRILEDFNFKIGGGGIFDHVRKTVIVRDKKDTKKMSKTDWVIEEVGNI